MAGTSNLEMVNLGDKVWFEGEKRPYTVVACNERFIICTKPFNLRHTVLYTILDLKEGIRGTHDLILNPYDFMVQEDIDECLADLVSGKIEISHRNRVQVLVCEIKGKKWVIWAR